MLKKYVKPPHDALAPRKATLIDSPKATDTLRYILFIDGKTPSGETTVPFEARWEDPDTLRAQTLRMKKRPGFHVYYKHGEHWYGVPKHFDELQEAMPYLQGGHRVLIEYRFTARKPKFLVCPNFGYTATGGQRTYKTADELMELWDIQPEDCIIQIHPNYPPHDNTLIVIRPLAEEDYDLARKRLKHHGIAL